MKIIKSSTPASESIVRKYAHIKSESKPGTEYVVVKIRVIKPYVHYKYRCNCPDHMYRNRDCKHIWQFKEKEQASK